MLVAAMACWHTATVAAAATDDDSGQYPVRDRVSATYHHVTADGAGTGGTGWIIGDSRRRASSPTAERKKYQVHHRDNAAEQQHQQNHEWPSPDAASSLSEVVVVPSPHHNAIATESSSLTHQPSDSSSLWHSKRLAYVTKSSPSTAAPPSSTPQGNAALLAEVLGQKSGLNGTVKGVSGSKGFQNDLMDMLGKSTFTALSRNGRTPSALACTDGVVKFCRIFVFFSIFFSIRNRFRGYTI